MNKPIGRFIEGSIWRHLTTMSLTNAVSLIMVFFADFINIFFIARLGVTELTASIGFASTVMFFPRTFSIALGITTSVLVSRHIGRNEPRRVRHYVVNTSICALLISSLIAVIMWFTRDTLVSWVGATGSTQHYASDFLAIVLPGTIFFALASCGGQIIRAHGEARLSMWLGIATAVISIILNPIFIFLFQMGLNGAAWATFISQLAMMLMHGYYVIYRFRLISRFRLSRWLADIPEIWRIATPTMLTNIASPISAAFAANQMAKFGDDAIAAFAITQRLLPLALAVIFALSGAVAPIIGQNAGAGQFTRVREAVHAALIFNWITVVLVAILLYALHSILPGWFSLHGQAAELLIYFCSGVALFFGFDGMVFCVNAGFNNLGKPVYSTLNNFGRVFLGAIPFVWLGQHYLGARGVVLGYMAESLWVAPISWYVIQRLIRQYEHGEKYLTYSRERGQ
ncbi:MAG: MATE family efflux transporter [Cardiobacteriaceae bacterium]|nr:MATE family efflux transporter [Cardiobacteriaceae bacterium]